MSVSGNSPAIIGAIIRVDSGLPCMGRREPAMVGTRQCFLIRYIASELGKPDAKPLYTGSVLKSGVWVTSGGVGMYIKVGVWRVDGVGVLWWV